MASQCSICLSSIKEPVSIPCGHIYCAECLGEYINAAASPNSYNSTCPTCRTEFPIVSPERTCLPKQVQKYLFPIIRRVYLPDAPAPSPALQAENQRLLNCLNASQNTRQRLEDQVAHLMQQCERHMSAAAAHAKGEKDAMLEVERLRRKVEYEMRVRKDFEVERDAEMRRSLDLVNELERYRKEEGEVGSDESGNSGAGDMRDYWAMEPIPIRGRIPFTVTSSDEDSSEDEHPITVRRPGAILSSARISEQTQRQNVLHPSPIRRPNKRHFRLSNPLSDGDSDGLLSEDEEPPQQNTNTNNYAMARAPRASEASSSITPRRRVVRELPFRPCTPPQLTALPQPPTKRMRVAERLR
ncbi:hypothetical protein E1B28_007722 [Marasmius oreades]|uniref:RING-type domain-containing protein n=1 Tax=Marasmius oreades TaxID=181124 RepID=A0A9P7S276_9AGAR|nr:uncharacterized protein E1B28_007722 [Marasmius oreades]KAG7094106.1 hypothetical protein E1B28_007722 [Marasmius oreades]